MNKPHILLQDDDLSLFTAPVKKFAEENSYDITVISRHEIGITCRHISNRLDKWSHAYPLLVIGSLGMVRGIMGTRNDKCTTSLPNDIQNFTPSKWKQLFGLKYINHTGILQTVAQIQSQWHGHREPLYLRDAGPYKQLRGGLYTRRDFRIISAISGMRDDDTVFAATVTEVDCLEVEYGIVVVDNKVVGTLMTKMNGLLHANSHVTLPTGVVSFVEQEIIPVFPEKEYLVNVVYYRRSSCCKIVDFNMLNHWIWPDEDIACEYYTAWMNALIKREKEE